jgi:hypothetical protein
MASVTQLARDRRSQLKSLRSALIKTEAGFRLVRREVDRLYNRKQSIPEAEDLVRLLEKMTESDRFFDGVTAIAQQMASSWQ